MHPAGASVLVSCGSCHVVGQEGLRCRINQSGTTVDADWDAERQVLCCRIPQQVMPSSLMASDNDLDC
jgi:hypothetical protein